MRPLALPRHTSPRLPRLRSPLSSRHHTPHALSSAVQADDDTQAIACLRRAVAADPLNLDALLALGVSYTNELAQTRALKHLQLWLESHPEFATLDVGGGAAGGVASSHNPFELQRRVTDQFLRAVRLHPQHADLHAVLGVLYNLSRE